jgi:hypothetical protein
LGEAFRISFERRPLGNDRNVNGWVVLGANQSVLSEVRRSTKPCYVVFADAELKSVGTSPSVTFRNQSDLIGVLRGRELSIDDAGSAKALPHYLVNMAPLAYKEGLPWWGIQDGQACRHQYVGLPPPALADGEPLFGHFCGQRFAALLPLVQYVRSLSDEPNWEPPPLQATFMFDDPNLHWRSYGFIDYASLVRHATESNYHASFATIPLDAWFAHPSTSALFRQHAARVSLLYHGNDHVSHELGRGKSPGDIQRMLQQALGRIARLEARENLQVTRIMAPPHGACSELAITEMARAGFEAVCVSRGSLYFHNRGTAWTRTIGMRPCDVVAGLPVIPRFGLSKMCSNDVLIAALLHQPIVPITHHQAVADGFGLLGDVASVVNSLGKVAWSDTRTISRSLYSRRQCQGILSVRMWSKRICIPVPEGTTRIRVERPWLKHDGDEPLVWRAVTPGQVWNVVPHSEAIAAESGTVLEIASGSAPRARGEAPDVGPYRLAAVARRMLTESRDRALPSIHSMARSARRIRTPKLRFTTPDPATRR